MENCLVTKLNATVADPNKKMEYLGGFFAGCYFASKGEVVSLICTTPIGATAELKIVDGDAYFTTQDGSQNNGTTAQVNHSSYLFYIKGSVTGIIRVLVCPDEHKSLESLGDFSVMDFDKASIYVSGLTVVSTKTVSPNYPELYGTNLDFISKNATDIRLTNLKGNLNINLAKFANSTTLQNVTLNGEGNNVQGSIENFSKATSMNTLNVYNRPNVSGSISALAAAQVANGRTSGTLIITVGDKTQITTAGTTHATAYSYTITFNSSLPNGYSIA